MNIEHYSLEKLKKDISAIIGQYLDLSTYRVFFFGSRVSGKGSERSDIDIGIEGKEPIPVSLLEKIRENINQLPTLYSIDVVDFLNASDDFKKVAREHTEEVTSSPR